MGHSGLDYFAVGVETPTRTIFYADDAMLRILGNSIEVQRRLGKVLAKIKEFGIISGLVLNLEKSFALAQKIPGTRIWGATGGTPYKVAGDTVWARDAVRGIPKANYEGAG